VNIFVIKVENVNKIVFEHPYKILIQNYCTNYQKATEAINGSGN
jgi:hypothetical protein